MIARYTREELGALWTDACGDVPPPQPEVGVAKPLQQAVTPYLEVTGNTENPCSSMMNGYSLVPWLLPRYFTIRMRRVVI